MAWLVVKGGIKRLLFFSTLYPPLALVMFTAPNKFEHLLDWIVEAYTIVIIPTLLLAGVDRAISAQPFRVARTAATATLATVCILIVMSGRQYDIWPVLMFGLVAGVPAAMCSWLSDMSLPATS